MARNKSESYEAMEEGSEAHWEVVQRILFLYAKLNPGLGYVQGMNEIIGPIYYVMASDPLADNRSKCTALIDCDWLYSSTSKAIFSFRLIIHRLTTVGLPLTEYAEADCFFCFTALMSEIRDFFIKTLDESEGGIKQKMAQLSALLKEKDAEVWQRLEQQNLYPQYYSFRWLTLILSQEFALPDVVRLWDSLFSDDKRFNFLVRVCCAMIM